jgi:hypothetical protein
MAETYGLTGIGPINDPKDMAATFKRGIEIVTNG